MLNIIKENMFLFIFIFLIVVAPSFMFGAMQFFVYIILALFLLAIIGILVVRWKVKKITQQGGGFNEPNAGFKGSKTQDPDVKIYTSGDKKRVSSDVGDYVDFEEIKD